MIETGAYGGAIVAEVDAFHIRVASEPTCVVVDSVTQVVRRFGPGLAARYNAVAVAAGKDLARLCRDIHEHPMEEVDSWQRRGHLPTFFVYVIRSARHVTVMV
jgi:hypothetical protein